MRTDHNSAISSVGLVKWSESAPALFCFSISGRGFQENRDMSPRKAVFAIYDRFSTVVGVITSEWVYTALHIHSRVMRKIVKIRPLMYENAPKRSPFCHLHNHKTSRPHPDFLNEMPRCGPHLSRSVSGYVCVCGGGGIGKGGIFNFGLPPTSTNVWMVIKHCRVSRKY